MNRSIMMRKYGLDESQAYIEQSTLLEPNNFIPSWEAGGEEKKEVSLALRKLRLKYDGIHKLVKSKEDQLEMIKKGVEKIGQEEHKVEQDTGGTQQETEYAKQELNSVKLTHDFEMLYQSQYQYMLERMKKDLISLQLSSNDLMESLKSKKTIMREELDKQRKSKENKLQSKYKLDNLMKNIDHEQQKRQERIISLQQSIKNKEDALQKRMDRVKRQSEIAEAAANENKDTNEIKLRENFMIQKLWSQFFKKKMSNEMKKSYQVENAFQKIKAQTGNSDVQEIVQKFLTREQTYTQLLRAVNENEKKLEYLRLENEKKRQELQQLQINFNALQQKNPDINQIKSQSQNEVQQLEKEVEFLEKELLNVNEREKKINLAGDQVGGWANKVLTKLNSQLHENEYYQYENRNKQKSILELFNSISDVVNVELDTVIIQTENSQEKGFQMATKDFMSDFATEEFLNKNIRVRPISGMTIKEVDDRQSDRISRSNMIGIVDHNDDEEKFNKMINLDMEDQRKKQKLHKQEIEKQRQIEAEKLAKVQQAKKK